MTYEDKVILEMTSEIRGHLKKISDAAFKQDRDLAKQNLMGYILEQEEKERELLIRAIRLLSSQCFCLKRNLRKFNCDNYGCMNCMEPMIDHIKYTYNKGN